MKNVIFCMLPFTLFEPFLRKVQVWFNGYVRSCLPYNKIITSRISDLLK